MENMEKNNEQTKVSPQKKTPEKNAAGNSKKKRAVKSGSRAKMRRRKRLKRRIIFYTTRGFVLLVPILLIGFLCVKFVTFVHSKLVSANIEQTAASTSTTAQALAEPVSLTISVVGDCTFGRDENFNYNTSFDAYYAAYGKDYFFENVRDIFSADDLTIANLEGTLTNEATRAQKQYAFKGIPEYAQILTSGSIEAVNIANNHSHDYGDSSYTDTESALDAEGIIHFGYEATSLTEVRGVKIGLVGIYELSDHLGCSEQLKTNIAKVKSEGADLVIVIFHWGNELDTVPTQTQQTLGHLAIDEGADLVCGHHPHVLQGIETYNGKNIVYSLGNFCFGGNSSPSDKDTMIFQQTFTVDENGVQADNVTNIIPCSISSASAYNDYKPTPAQGSEYDRIMQKISERSSIF